MGLGMSHAYDMTHCDFTLDGIRFLSAPSPPQNSIGRAFFRTYYPLPCLQIYHLVLLRCFCLHGELSSHHIWWRGVLWVAPCCHFDLATSMMCIRSLNATDAVVLHLLFSSCPFFFLHYTIIADIRGPFHRIMLIHRDDSRYHHFMPLPYKRFTFTFGVKKAREAQKKTRERGRVRIAQGLFCFLFGVGREERLKSVGS